MECSPIAPIIVLLVPLALYLIWDYRQWNKIIEERKQIYKDLKDAFKEFNEK
jgi:hypothetical protein